MKQALLKSGTRPAGKQPKRYLAFILTLVMIFALLPAITPSADASYAIRNAITAYNTIHGGSGTLTATSDPYTGTTVTITGEVRGATTPLELDLYTGTASGSTSLTVKWAATLTGTVDDSMGLIRLTGGQTINQYSGTFEVVDEALIENTGPAIFIMDGSYGTKLTVSGGTIRSTGTGGYEQNTLFTIRGYLMYSGYTTITVDGGLIESTAISGTALDVTSLEWVSTVRINGGEIRATGGAGVAVDATNAVDLVLNGGEIRATGGYGKAVRCNGAELYIQGSVIEATGNNSYAIESDSSWRASSVTMTGGSVFAMGWPFSLVSNSSSYNKPDNKVRVENGIIVSKYGVNNTGGSNNSTYYGPTVAGYTHEAVNVYLPNPLEDTYESGTYLPETHVKPESATAFWNRVAGKSGISYAYGDNIGFIVVPGVAVGGSVLSAAQLDYSIPNNHKYTGAAQGIGNVTAKSGVSGLGDITVKYNGSTELPIDAGTYAVTVDVAVTPDSDFNAVSGMNLGEYTIAKASAPSIEWPTASAITYGEELSKSTLSGGSTQYGSFSWTDSSHIPAVNNNDCSVTFTPNADTIKNYEAIAANTKTVSITVNKATYSGESAAIARNIRIDTEGTMTIDLQELLPSVTGIFGTINFEYKDKVDADSILGTPSLSGVTLSVPYNKATEVGKTAVINITIKSTNYNDINAQINFTTMDKTVLNESDIIFDDESKTYNGTAQPISSATISGSFSGGDFTYNYSYKGSGTTDYAASKDAPTEVGTYSVTVFAENADYIGEKTAVLTITPKDISSDMLSAAPVTYNGEAQTPVLNVTDTATLIIGTDYTVTLDSQTNAGTYPIEVEGIGNYSGKASVDFVILPKDMDDAIITLKEQTMTYTGSAITVEIDSVTVAGLDVAAGDYTTAYTNNVLPGTATLTITANQNTNFTGSASITFQIEGSGNAIQDPPQQFEMSYQSIADTSYTVTIPQVAGAEYSFDGLTWSETNSKENCYPNDTITGYIRMAAKEGYDVSPAVSNEITLPLFQVKIPTSAPNGGTFSSSQTVTLSTQTVDAIIYYTTDNSTPNSNSNKYESPIALSNTTTIKAIAVKEGMRDSDILTVTFTKAAPPVIIGDGGSQPPSNAAKPSESTETKINAEVNGDSLDVTLNPETGSVNANLEKATIDNALKNAAESGIVTVVIPKNAAIDEKTTVSATIESDALKAVADSGAALQIDTPALSMTFDASVLKNIAGAGEVKIEAGLVNTSELSNAQQKQVGDRPVYDFSVTAGGRPVTDLGGSVSISIPYSPARGEDLNAIIICYIDAEGNVKTLPGGVYDAATGLVTFSTDHFSLYMIAYNQISYSDVANNHWAKNYITYLSAREVFNGIGDSKFNPSGHITRAMFVQVLANLDGADLSIYTKSSYPDVSSSDWYLPAIEWAASNAIITVDAAGSAFEPNAFINREEMAVLLERYISYKEYILPQSASTPFADEAQITPSALNAVKKIQAANIVNGKPGNFYDPKAQATRAEVAAIFVRLLDICL